MADLLKVAKEKASNRVIGYGPSFPFLFSGIGGVRSTDVSHGVEKINQSIHTILSTRLGERVSRPTFGSDLAAMVFEPNDVVFIPLVEREVKRSLYTWEKRIKVTSIDIVGPAYLSGSTVSAVDPHTVGIRINYIVERLNVEGSYVYPFRRETAPMNTNLPSSYQGS